MRFYANGRELRNLIKRRKSLLDVAVDPFPESKRKTVKAIIVLINKLFKKHRNIDLKKIKITYLNTNLYFADGYTKAILDITKLRNPNRWRVKYYGPNMCFLFYVWPVNGLKLILNLVEFK